MTTNPYFLPNVDVSNYATRLLSDTIGTETIPIDVFEILEYIEELGITCKFTDKKFEDNSEYAITELSKDGQRRIYINSKFYGRSFQDITDITKRRHCRFTLAHELGHCFIPAHADYLTQQLMLDKSNLHAKKYSFTKEYEANTFASELLIPSSTIGKIEQYGSDFKQIVENKSKKYDTSFTATALKVVKLLKDINCICIQFDADTKQIIQYKYSEAFGSYKKGLFFNRDSKIYGGSVTSSLMKGNDKSYYQKYNDPKDWFPNFYGNDSAYLNEWAFKVGPSIITFLELVDTSEYALYF